MLKSLYRFVKSNRRPRKGYKSKSKQYYINKGIWDDLQHLRERNRKLTGLLKTLAEKTGNAVVGDMIVPLKEKESYEKQQRDNFIF